MKWPCRTRGRGALFDDLVHLRGGLSEGVHLGGGLVT